MLSGEGLSTFGANEASIFSVFSKALLRVRVIFKFLSIVVTQVAPKSAFETVGAANCLKKAF